VSIATFLKQYLILFLITAGVAQPG